MLMLLQVSRGKDYNRPFQPNNSYVVAVTLNKNNGGCNSLEQLYPDNVRALPYAYTTMNTRKQCCGTALALPDN